MNAPSDNKPADPVAHASRAAAAWGLLSASAAQGIVDYLPTAITFTDALDCRLLFLNRAAETPSGLSRDALAGKFYRDLLSEKDADASHARLRTFAQSGRRFVVEDESWRGRDGPRTMRTKRLLVDGANHTRIIVGISEDLTEQLSVADSIERLAGYDSLTKLPNRVLFRRRLEEAKDALHHSGQAVALYQISLNGFKNINKTFGQPVGDQVLRILADRLRKKLRAGDFAGWLGGDEFAIFRIVGTAQQDIAAAAQDLAETVSSLCEVGGQRVAPSASVGVSVATSGSFSVDELLKSADIAAEHAKASVKTCAIYDPSMDEAGDAKRVFELELRNALARGEMHLHYQPFADSHSRRIRGFEALLRWQHPEKGMIPPGQFIPFAEESGLIVSLGEWALRKACDDASDWPSYISLAVNVSPAQFQDGLPQVLAKALAASRLAPGRLELEITESVLLDSNSNTITVLTKLRELGVRIALDDFGTGYASLSYLRSFPFDKIKVDQSFVREVHTKPDSLAIVRAVAALATSLGIPTTAEGVETEEQLMTMRDAGCTYCQGHFFGMGMPNAQVQKLLNERRALVRKPGYH